jgi:hypothetical protein
MTPVTIGGYQSLIVGRKGLDANGFAGVLRHGHWKRFRSLAGTVSLRRDGHWCSALRKLDAKSGVALTPRRLIGI